MAKIGQEVSGDEEFGWIGCQAEGAIVVDDIVWLTVVVGGWFWCTIRVRNDPIDRVSVNGSNTGTQMDTVLVT